MDTPDAPGLDWRKNPRRRFSAEQRLEMVRECEQPGVSVAQIAQRHGINANLLFTWRKRYGAGHVIAVGRPAVLLPVTVAESMPRVKVGAKPKRKRPRNSAARRAHAALAAGTIEIEMPGARIFLHGAVSELNLAAVLRALARR